MSDTVKAVKVSRTINAKEWAIRQGIAIAKKHLPSGSFEEQSALCADIAEALTRTRRTFEPTPPEAP